jgi:hypothetical protein
MPVLLITHNVAECCAALCLCARVVCSCAGETDDDNDDGGDQMNQFMTNKKEVAKRLQGSRKPAKAAAAATPDTLQVSVGNIGSLHVCD